MVVALSSQQYQLILNSVPRSVKDALECPPVQELVNQGAKQNELEACLALEIARVANMLTVGGNLRQGQSVEIAHALIADYPNESLQDFCICLRQGMKGKYGEIFRFDIMVINTWFQAYLQEKYQAVEDKLMAEKEDLYRKVNPEPADPDKHQKWLDKLKEAIGPMTGKIKPITDADVKAEGQQEPKKREPYHHNNPEVLKLQIARQKLMRAASEFYKDRRTLDLKTFEVEGIQFGAENESDANEIYRIATES